MEGGGFSALEQGSQALPQAIHARVGELAGHGGYDGQVFVWSVEHVAVAAYLLADGPQGIFTAALLKLVQHDKVGHVEHLDLFQLRVRAKFRGHHVEGVVGHGRDGVAALTDAAGFAKDEVEADRLRHLDGAVEVVGNLRARAAAGQRAHEQVVVGQGVHADAVAQQGTAGALSCRVNAQQADLEVRIVAHDAQHQLVQEAGFSGTTGAGEPDDGNVTLGRSGTCGFQSVMEGGVVGAFREGQQEAHEVHVVGADRSVETGHTRLVEQVHVLGDAHEVVDHTKQAHGASVIRRVDLRDACLMQRFDFWWRDGASTATEDTNVLAAGFIEELPNVREVLQVAALVGGQGDGVCVFLDGTIHDVLGRTVVAKVDDLRTGGLHQTPNDVDGSVVAVEQRGGGDDAHRTGARREVGLATLIFAHALAWDFRFIKSAPGSVMRIWLGQRTVWATIMVHSRLPFMSPVGRCTGEHSGTSKTTH